MLKFVTVTKRQPLGLPDPSKAATPEKAARMEAVNRTIIENSTTPDNMTTRRGVKRKRNNNHYSPETRAKIAKYAAEHGNTRAAKHFSKLLDVSIGESAVRFMRKSYQMAKSDNKTGEITELVHQRRGKPLLLGELDKLVADHLNEIRKAGGIVNRHIVLATARGIVLHENRSLLVENGGPIRLDKGWSNSFLQRHGFVKRKATKAARKVPLDFEQKREEFISSVGETIAAKSIPSDLVINFDQTGVKIVPVSNWTLASQGIKQVSVIGVEDKREITMLLGSTASGNLLPPQVIYQGLTDKCQADYNFPDEWHVTHSANHWSNEDTMLKYVDEVLVPYTKKVKQSLRLPVRQKSLAIFDVFAAHRCDSFLNLLKKRNFEVRFVPAGCTSELQPMDLSVNGDFKTVMKDQFSQWYAEKVSASLKDGDITKPVDLRISVMKPIHARWMVSAYQTISKDKECVLRGWRLSGLSDALIE